MAPKIVVPLVISHTESATHWFEKKIKIPPDLFEPVIVTISLRMCSKDKDC